MADLLDAVSQPAVTEAGTPLRLVARLYDHQGLEIACIAERERDRAFGLCKRLAADGNVFDPLTPFLTLGAMQGLALQVAARNPKAIQHNETPHALACGFLAILAAVQAGAGITSPTPAGASDVPASHPSR